MIRIARNISTNISRNVSRSIGTEPDLVLESYGTDAQAAYSAYDLGNKRGSVVETGETVYGDFDIISGDLLNGGFETAGGGGADVFADWGEVTTGTSTVNMDTTDFDTGTASGRLDIDGSNSKAELNQYGILSSATYSYTIRAKCSSSATLSIGDLTSPKSVSLTSSWATYTGTFTGTSGGSFTLKRGSATSQSIWIDSVEITELDTYRTLDVAYHNPAVRVRRDSDNIHKSFAGGEFTQIENWVNEDVASILSADNSLFTGSTVDWTAGTLDTTNDELDLSLGAFAGSVLSGTYANLPQNGQTIAYTFTITNYASGSILLRNNGGALQQIITSKSANGTYTGTKVITENFTGLQLIAGGTGFVGSISELTLTITQANGHVATWYDQSGVEVQSSIFNNNHDFTSGWTTYGTASIDDSDSYTTTAGGGIAKSIGSISGDWVRIKASGTTTASSIQVYAYLSNTLLHPISLTGGAFDFDVIVQTDDEQLYLRNGAAGTTNYDTFTVEIVNKAHNDATQATADSQPKIVSAGALTVDANGNVALSFDGTDDSLRAVGFPFNYTNFGIFAVAESDAVAVGGIVSGLDGFNDGTELLYLATGPRLAINALDLDVTDTVTDVVLMSANHDGSTQRLAVDGVESTQASTETVSTTAPLDIGTRVSSNYLDGNIACLVLYSADKSTDRAAIEQAISNTITTALS